MAVSAVGQNLESLGKQDLHKHNHFGAAVALDGSRALIAAPSEIVNDRNYQGAVYVFENQNQWMETARLEASDGDGYDYFGQDVAVVGNMAAIGAPGKRMGAVYIFEETGGIWQETQIIEPELPAGQGFNPMRFGNTIALSEAFLFVTAPAMLTESQLRTSVVFVYQRTDEGWTFLQQLASPTGDDEAKFGDALAVQGNRLVVGAPEANGGATNSGAAYLYEWEDSAWTFKHTFLYPESNAYEHFGASVDIDGDQLLIGSLMHVFDPEEGPVGTAHVFVHSGATWFHAAMLSSPYTERNDFYGESVGIAGDLAVVSAVRSDHSNATDAGSVHVFRQDNGFWREVYRLLPSEEEAQSHMYLGGAIALSGFNLLVGAPLADNLNDDSGNTYIHDLTVLVDTDQQGEALDYALYPNNPNPFSDFTIIQFDLPQAGTVQVQVFDVAGQLVETLANERYPAGEGYALTWRPQHLPAGTYYVRLQTGKHLATIKAIYIP